MSIDLTHWIDQLQVDPGFAALQAEQAGEFDRAVHRLLDLEDEKFSDPLLVARLIGELRGMRSAQRLPSRVARLARETND